MILGLFLFFFIINISFSNQKTNNFTLKIRLIGTKLESLYIDSNEINDDDDDEDTKCHQWIPSLINPVILVPIKIDVSELDIFENRNDITIAPPVLFHRCNSIIAHSCKKSIINSLLQIQVSVDI